MRQLRTCCSINLVPRQFQLHHFHPSSTGHLWSPKAALTDTSSPAANHNKAREIYIVFEIDVPFPASDKYLLMEAKTLAMMLQWTESEDGFSTSEAAALVHQVSSLRVSVELIHEGD